MFGKRKAESPLEPELPIAPMLDMSFCSLKWAFVVQVMDVCHASGFEGIRFASPTDVGGR